MTGHAELQVLWLKPLLSTLDRSSTKLSKPICATTPRTTCGWSPLDTHILQLPAPHHFPYSRVASCLLQNRSPSAVFSSQLWKSTSCTTQHTTQHSRGIIELNLALS